MVKTPLRPDLPDGAIVLLAPEENRVIQVIDGRGRDVTRPRIGVRLVYEHVGMLPVSSGRLVVCDPQTMFLYDPAPLAKSIEPGEYPLHMVAAETLDADRVVAFGVVELAPRTPARYVPAPRELGRPEPWEDDDDPGVGIGVDTATATVADALYSSILNDELDGDSAPIADRVNETLADGVHASIVQIGARATIPMGVWRSGFGDGVYDVWWGLDDQGRVCNLVVDFDVIANGLEGPAIPRKRIGASLEYIEVSSPRRPWWRFW